MNGPNLSNSISLSQQQQRQQQHLFQQALSLCQTRKRKPETMTYSYTAQALYAKRIRSMSSWISLVEQVTPENAEPVQCKTCLHSAATCMQFERPDVRGEKTKVDEIITIVTAVLSQTCTRNAKRIEEYQERFGDKAPYRSEKYPDGSSSIFFSLKKPCINLREYVARLVRYLDVSKSVFTVALIYLDRSRREDDLLCLTEMNVHRLLTTALMIAAKYLEDESHRNSTISRIGGVPSTAEMNMLEVQFLRRLKWNCSVHYATFEHYERIIFRNSNLCKANIVNKTL